MKNLKQIADELSDRLTDSHPYESEDDGNWIYYNNLSGYYNNNLVTVTFKHHRIDPKGEIVVKVGCGDTDEVIDLLKDIEHNQELTVERVFTTVKIEKV